MITLRQTVRVDKPGLLELGKNVISRARGADFFLGGGARLAHRGGKSDWCRSMVEMHMGTDHFTSVGVMGRTSIGATVVLRLFLHVGAAARKKKVTAEQSSNLATFQRFSPPIHY